MRTLPAGLHTIEISGLFGRPAHTIRLDKEFPTILTGANGTGKSTILRLVGAASKGDLATLATSPVSRFAMLFENIDDFVLDRQSDGTVHLQWGRNRGRLAVSPDFAALPDWALSALQSQAYSVPLSLDVMSDAAHEAGADFDEFQSVRDQLRRLDDTPLHAPAWLTEFAAAFPVLYVSDQRLITEPRDTSRTMRAGQPRAGRTRPTRLAVEAASRDIAERLRRADTEYARASQEFDRELPQRILDTMIYKQGSHDISEERLAELVEETRVRRDALRAVGLLDTARYMEPEVSAPRIEDSDVRRTMALVLETTLEKFSPLDNLQDRLSTLKRFLDERLQPKSLFLSRSEGIKFRLSSGEVITPRQLSSGEQQLVVLAHAILFEASEGTLVVVDEPEISLHVLWQDRLVTDLQAMGRAAGVRFLMATHSPTILADHPRLERALPGWDS